MATQIHRIDTLARIGGWDDAESTHGRRVLRRGRTRVSITYGPSTGLVHDAFAQVLDENGDAVQRWTLAHAHDTGKTSKVTEYLAFA